MKRLPVDCALGCKVSVAGARGRTLADEEKIRIKEKYDQSRFGHPSNSKTAREDYLLVAFDVTNIPENHRTLQWVYRQRA